VQGFSFAVPSTTVMEYVRPAGTTNQEGPLDQAYREGVQLLAQGHGQEAVAKLEQAKRLFPHHSEVDALIQSAQQAAATAPAPPITALVVLLIAGLGGAILFLRVRGTLAPALSGLMRPATPGTST
jgi:hypothetical protein